MRAILEAAVRPEGRLRLGTALSEIGRKYGLTNADVEAIEQVRDTRPAAHGFAVASRGTRAFNAAGLTVIDPWTAAY